MSTSIQLCTSGGSVNSKSQSSGGGEGGGKEGQVNAQQPTLYDFHPPNSSRTRKLNRLLLLLPPPPHTEHTHTHTTLHSRLHPFTCPRSSDTCKVPRGCFWRHLSIWGQVQSDLQHLAVQIPESRQVLDGFGISMSFWPWLGLATHR